MNQISPSVSTPKPSSARPALLASGGTQAFARALKSALAPGATAETEGETPVAEPAVRQKPAGDGKGLPDVPQGDAEDKDESADVAFAWFVVAPVVPQPAAIAFRLPVGARTIQLPEGAPAVVTGRPEAQPLIASPTAPDSAPAAAPEAPAADFALPAQAVPAPDGSKVAAAPAASATASAAPEQPAAPIRIALEPVKEAAKAPAAAPQPITLASIQPRAEAVQPLAAPLVAAAIEAPATRRPTPRETALSSVSAPAAAEVPRAHAVPATPDAQQPALDTRRHEWTAAMIDRIETMRDSGTRETSIRLSPDALGTVNVSIRHDGDRVHVHFSAETPAARAALAEAQPRLAELAESRGLRLGQTSVDGGAAGQGQRQDTAARPAFTTAPASAPAGDPATDSDDRVA